MPDRDNPLGLAAFHVDDHMGWSRATVALLRRLVARQEHELEELRAQLRAAERRIAAGTA